MNAESVSPSVGLYCTEPRRRIASCQCTSITLQLSCYGHCMGSNAIPSV